MPYSDVAPVSPANGGVAAVMPVTLEQVKQQARVETDAEDELIELHLQAAVDVVEQQTGYWLGQRAVDAYLPCLDYSESVYLPGGRVRSVTEVAYRDEDGVEQSWESKATTSCRLFRPTRPCWLWTAQRCFRLRTCTARTAGRCASATWPAMRLPAICR